MTNGFHKPKAEKKTKAKKVAKSKSNAGTAKKVLTKNVEQRNG